MVSHVFSARGWTVHVARDGANALELVRTHALDAMVCDLHMPDMDSFDVLAEVARIDKDLPVVILMGDDDTNAILEAIGEGAFDSVLKSYADHGPLVAAVERAGAHCTLARENAKLTTQLAARLVELEREVAERQEIERALRIARDSAMQANRAKSTFLANMSHELRTPLNAILGYAEMVKEDLEDHQADLVVDMDRIWRSGSHLLSLINDILDLAKIETGGVEVFLEVIDLGSLVEDVIGNMGPIAAKRGNRLVLVMRDPITDVVTDVRKLRQCVINLIGNAVKFTRDGTVTLTVSRDQNASGEWLTIDVEDTGIGMTPENCKAVFEAFAQADPSTSREYGGTGLGLAITRELASLLGGEVTVKSELGVGSTFTLWFPIREDEAEAIKGVRGVHTVARKALQGGVLVIDDDADMRRMMERHLTRAGLSVVLASTGGEGIAKARANPPAVICLDIVMPEFDGYQVLKALKADPVLWEVPVVLTTMLDDRDLGMALGANDYLVKPVSRDHLLRSLNRLGVGKSPGPVLVVDDAHVQRAVMRRVIEGEGWRCLEAENGQEALDVMKRERPSVLLLDLMMPVMDGYELLDRMAEIDSLVDVPVLIVTSAEISPKHQDFLERRVKAVIEKQGENAEAILSKVLGMVDAVLNPPKS